MSRPLRIARGCVVFRAAIRQGSDARDVRAVDHARMAASPRKIVVGFDGSAGALRALDAAAQLMGYGSTMTVVSVASEKPFESSDPLGLAREVLLRHLVSARYERRIGDAAEAIIDAADDIDADVIVVGRRGPGESNGILQGSVSADVVRRARCDVLVVG